LWEEFKKRMADGEDPKKVFEEIGVDRFCCRSVFMGQEDLIELVGKFKKS